MRIQVGVVVLIHQVNLDQLGIYPSIPLPLHLPCPRPQPPPSLTRSAVSDRGGRRACEKRQHAEIIVVARAMQRQDGRIQGTQKMPQPFIPQMRKRTRLAELGIPQHSCKF